MTALERFFFAAMTALMLVGTLVMAEPENPLALALKRAQPVRYFLQSCGH
jgi:hypothetical protein